MSAQCGFLELTMVYIINAQALGAERWWPCKKEASPLNSGMPWAVRPSKSNLPFYSPFFSLAEFSVLISTSGPVLYLLSPSLVETTLLTYPIFFFHTLQLPQQCRGRGSAQRCPSLCGQHRHWYLPRGRGKELCVLFVHTVYVLH